MPLPMSGGTHVLEALAGRTYNLGCAAYILICRGFYDESMNLVRSIGEISNLIFLSVVDKQSLRRWLAADRKTRLKEFSPARIRKLVDKEAPSLMYADRDWYSRFCEQYTHVTPSTKPNLHNNEGMPHVGGVLQPAGLAVSLSELATVLAFVALPICRYFDFADLTDALGNEMDSNDSRAEPAS